MTSGGNLASAAVLDRLATIMAEVRRCEALPLRLHRNGSSLECASLMSDLRIGIDVGGTFTDFVLLDAASGKLVHHKEPSTPADPAAAVEAGIGVLLSRAGTAAAAVGLVAHGTTIGLNAILQRRGAKVGVITSHGNRDLIEIGRVRMADPYGFFALPEEPMVPRDRVVEISARVASDGRVEFSPADEELDHAAAIMRNSGVQAVCVVLLNAYLAPDFEADVAMRLAERLDGIPVAASTSIWAEAREYERCTVAVMNAFISPIMKGYYSRLERDLVTGGFDAPLTITTNNGGAIDIATAYDRPVDSILSGPASGVVAAIDAARRAEVTNIVTFDMGGTSADIAISDESAPEITTSTMLGETPLMLPVVNVGAIGAGGGSILHVDSGGLLKVGPASAGADPGPACYGRGGAHATITDCYLALSILDADNFAEGRLPLSPDAAKSALTPLAERLGMQGADAVERVAEAALRVASSMMATEVRKALARRGANPREFTLVPYGGAGPTHAALLAGEAGISRILVPPSPGTFCALGAAVSDLRRDFVKSVRLHLDADPSDGQEAEIEAAVGELVAMAREWMARNSDRVESWQLQVSGDVHYPRQAFDLTVTHRRYAPGDRLGKELLRLFHEEHQSVYKFSEPNSPVEVGRLVLSAVGALGTAHIEHDASQATNPARSRLVWVNGGRATVPVLDRGDPELSQARRGPMIVEQPDTTIFVPAGWEVTTTSSGALLLTVHQEASR